MVDVVKEALASELDWPFMKRDHPKVFEGHMKTRADQHIVFLQHIRDNGPDEATDDADKFLRMCYLDGGGYTWDGTVTLFLDHLIERLKTPDKENKT